MTSQPRYAPYHQPVLHDFEVPAEQGGPPSHHPTTGQSGAARLATVRVGGTGYLLRRATVDDVPAIVALIAADQIGSTRDGGPGTALAPYLRAFAAIDADPAQLLVVVDAPDAPVVGTMQLTFIPGMARRGSLRAQIEAVRVAQGRRGGGLGAAVFGWAIDEARRRGCTLVQLTSDKRRTGAHRFYDRLGFVASHEGYKLLL